ncbi:MAG: acyltransferase [Phycisphaerales bacterium]|nr:acyltransferase [Phycisphaerales bacterium]
MPAPQPASPMHERFLNTKFFGSLDGLRCLSILAVIWHHTAGHSFPGIPLSERGHHGVTLFFAISGFLITTLLLRERSKTGDISLKKFYIRRSLRIFPLYYSVLILYTVLVFLMERTTDDGREFFQNLPAYATYTSNWFVDLKGERVIFYFAWSLATEEQFYLVWPWIEKYLKFWGPVVFMTIMLAIAFLASSGMLGLQDGFLRTVLESIMPGICLGAILAHLLHHPSTYPILAKILGWRFSSIVFLGLFVGYCALPTLNEWVVHSLGVLLVGSCVAREDHFLRPLCRIRIIRWMGAVSYGMYMLHMLAKNAYDKLAPKLGAGRVADLLHLDPAILQFVGTTILVVIGATISFRYYESIFLKLKHRFSTV